MSKRGHDFRWNPPDEDGLKTKSWKDAYRQRCMDRLRDSRFKHLLAKRQSDSPKDDVKEVDKDDGMIMQDRKDKIFKDIQAMMTKEWELIQRQDVAQSGIMPEEIPAPSVDEMIAIMEDILAELRQEKSQQSTEEEVCEEFLQREEEELCQAFYRLNAVEVICPVCQKDCLQEGAGFISCKCGVHINTEQDCISLENVSSNILRGVAKHEEGCDQKPSFSQTNEFGISMLILTCQKCDYHCIIV